MEVWTMNMGTPAMRPLIGLAVTFLLVGCGSNANASPSSPASNTTSVQASNPIGQMTVGRARHTATPLADGRILIAGGFGSGLASLASAEIYDPTSGTFSPTGAMATARDRHAATPLADGRILIAGGFGSGLASLASAELYDPTSGTFSPTGAMATARDHPTAILLADGRVLVTGGTPAPGLAAAELFDPRSGTFSPTGSMAIPREHPTATLLADGRVLVTGGQDETPPGDPTGLASAELYDPTTGTFSPTDSMATARILQTATRLADGRVLVTGGVETLSATGGFLASGELYDPKTGTFTATGSMVNAHVGYTVTLLSDGRVLVTGGQEDPTGELASAGMLASAELYDPTTGTFSPTGQMTVGRASQTATQLADGRVLITGGVEAMTGSGPGSSLASAELYDPKTGTFSATGPQ
jgi:galactose oxidase-like protein/Kelch motif protein